MHDSAGKSCFVDSNVWLYAFIDSDDPGKSLRARELLKSVEPVVSTQVVNEVCVNLVRRASCTEEQVREIVRSFYANYRVVELTESVLLDASKLREQNSLSFWDSLILAATLTAGVSILFTEDMQHGLTVNGTLEIQNPFVAV